MITHTESAANSAASILLTAVPRERHKVQQVTWSYSAAPTGGKITITGLQGGTFEIDVTAGGPGAVPLPPSSYGQVNTAVQVSIAAAGSGVVGKLNVFSETE